jgi:spermidine synthase
MLGFGKLGPAQCSGLPVRRYDQDDLVRLLGDGFQLVEAFDLDHRTPTGAIQRFFAAHFVRRCTNALEARGAVS